MFPLTQPNPSNLPPPQKKLLQLMKLLPVKTIPHCLKTLTNKFYKIFLSRKTEELACRPLKLTGIKNCVQKLYEFIYDKKKTY